MIKIRDNTGEELSVLKYDETYTPNLKWGMKSNEKNKKTGEFWRPEHLRKSFVLKGNRKGGHPWQGKAEGNCWVEHS